MNGIYVRVRKFFFPVTILVLLVLIYAMFPALEKKLIYFPLRYPEGYWDPSTFGIEAEDCSFAAADGVRLHGWYFRTSGERQPRTLLWFHGNAGNITHRLDNIRLLLDRGIDVFIFDYRGYGKSEGEPDEEGIYLDGRAAFDFLVREKGVAAKRIVFFGRSLGSAVAVDVAIEKPPGGIILETAFPDARSMAKLLVPILPIGPFMSTKFDNIGKIRNIHIPLLFIHGDRDRIVPYEYGKKLYEAANQPKEFYAIPGADHNDTYIVGGAAYFSKLQMWWNSL